MTVAVIFTGGTIGSRLNDDGFIGTAGAKDYRLINLYNQKICDTVNFITYEPYTVLSENLKSTNLLKLIDCIREVIKDNKIDGIIVTHGTDTLSYTSAILSYVFANISVPLVLVSSDYVLEDSRANGLTNFTHAIEFIKLKRNGVFVSYENKGGIPTIHYGSRLSNPVPFSGDVFSIKNAIVGTFDNNLSFIYNEIEPDCCDFLPLSDNLRLTETSNILRLVPSCGMTYPHLDDSVKAVLLESYHSGTICVDDNLINFISKADNINIPVFLSGLNSEVSLYDSVKAYKDAGITAINDISPTALYCKLWLILSNDLNVYELVKKTFSYDIVISDKIN